MTLSGPLLSNTMFTMAHWLVLKLLYISSLTTFKIPLCFVHSVTLLRRFMRAILKSNKPAEGGQGGPLFNLPYQIWLDLSFVVLTQTLHGYKQGKTVASFNSPRLQRERERVDDPDAFCVCTKNVVKRRGNSIEFHTIKCCCQQGTVYGAASEHSNKYKKQISHMVPGK